MNQAEPLRYELVENFIAVVRNAQSRQEFMNRVQEFDARFIEEQNGQASMMERPRSVEKLPPLPQEKPRNPFRTQAEDYRGPSVSQMQSHEANQFAQGNVQGRGVYSRTEQNFYRGSTPQSAAKNQGYAQQHHNQTNTSFGYGMPGNQQYTPSGNNMMGGMSYNAYGQKEYEDLKEQFFRPPVMPRPEPYQGENSYLGSRGGENTQNYQQMRPSLAMSSSTDLLSGQIQKGGSGRGQNPFQRQ